MSTSVWCLSGAGAKVLKTESQARKWWWGTLGRPKVKEIENDSDIIAPKDDLEEGEGGGREREEEEEEEEEAAASGKRRERCPDAVKQFAYWRVNHKENPNALAIGRVPDLNYWPDFIVSSPNPTFTTGPFWL